MSCSLLFNFTLILRLKTILSLRGGRPTKNNLTKIAMGWHVVKSLVMELTLFL
jgi:hypothetical protein